MSAFLGIIGSDRNLSQKAASLFPTSAFTYKNSKYSVYGDGAPNRFFAHSNPETESGWVVSGVGLPASAPYKPFSTTDWASAFNQQREIFRDLNGHFVAFRFSPDHLEFFTDVVGIRSLFLAKNGDSLIFSTRYDWILRLLPSATIDWHALGSTWLSINSFSGKSIVHEIRRVHGAGYVSIRDNVIQVETKPWSPAEETITTEGAISRLSDFCVNFQSDNSPISVGLSGGLDSRVLLAIMMGQPNTNFDLYTFTKNAHPDERVAQLLSKKANKEHLFHSFPTLTSKQILALLPEYAARTMLTASVPNLSSLIAYQQLGAQLPQSIDGGLGEIGRRRYLRSLEMNAQSAVFDKSPRRLLPYFIDVNANIFRSEIREKMETGLQEDLVSTLNQMPAAQDIGLENWLDLFSIRSRIPNLGGIQQEVIDDYIFHLMPFIQPAFLSAILNLPAQERKNARLFRSIIQQLAPQLTKIPLVKGDDSYPYRLKDFSAIAWMRAKRKIGMGHKNHGISDLLLGLEEYVRDTFTESFLKESGCYSKKKVPRLIDAFYTHGDASKANAINWLITFESFRGQL